MEEIYQDQYSDKIKAWEESKQQKIEADEWICEYCQQINRMDMKDKYSSYCKKCNKLNLFILEIVRQSIEQEKLQAKDKEQQDKDVDNQAIYKSKFSKIREYY